MGRLLTGGFQAATVRKLPLPLHADARQGPKDRDVLIRADEEGPVLPKAVGHAGEADDRQSPTLLPVGNSHDLCSPV